ncbi:RNA polymerase sigma factor [Pacificispira sp.]|uniref:RNA polymerase sigma factor n=1 Tax=Pacificispira sp. TaxID=2888761 RepID=UPI003BA843D3
MKQDELGARVIPEDDLDPARVPSLAEREADTGRAVLSELQSKRGLFLGFLTKRLASRAEAEDVLQEFCLRVLSRKSHPQMPDRLDAWLFAVLRSVLNDHYRKLSRRQRMEDALSRDPVQFPTVENDAELFGEICTCVGELLTDLREADADLIRQLDLGDEDRAGVAKSLGINQGALRIRLHRARIALRDRLMRHCGGCCRHGFDDCGCAKHEAVCGSHTR